MNGSSPAVNRRFTKGTWGVPPGVYPLTKKYFRMFPNISLGDRKVTAPRPPCTERNEVERSAFGSRCLLSRKAKCLSPLPKGRGAAKAKRSRFPQSLVPRSFGSAPFFTPYPILRIKRTKTSTSATQLRQNSHLSTENNSYPQEC